MELCLIIGCCNEAGLVSFLKTIATVSFFPLYPVVLELAFSLRIAPFLLGFLSL